ncbi:MAG: YgjV family protein [Clostridiales bacterium]|nr:YgjV family protein [Clostridiales bacterium]
MFTLLASTFVDILKNEWLGLLASAFILVSFLTTNQTKTRLINMVGCVIFVVYGFILPAYSTAFMNAALFVVHVVYLTKDFLKARKAKSEQPQATEETAEEKDATTAETSTADKE